VLVNLNVLVCVHFFSLYSRCGELLTKLASFKGEVLPSCVSQSVTSTLTETNPSSTLTTTVESWYSETNPSFVERAVLVWLRTEGERSEWSQILVRVGRVLFPAFIEFATTFASLFIRRETNPTERTVALKQFVAASRSIFTAHFDLCRTLLAVRDIFSFLQYHLFSTGSCFLLLSLTKLLCIECTECPSCVGCTTNTKCHFHTVS
jgi:hypothetical protein